jgi:hypothetical protein
MLIRRHRLTIEIEQRTLRIQQIADAMARGTEQSHDASDAIVPTTESSGSGRTEDQGDEGKPSPKE